MVIRKVWDYVYMKGSFCCLQTARGECSELAECGITDSMSALWSHVG